MLPAGEMIPTQGPQFSLPAVFLEQNGALGGDFSNPGDGDAAEARRNARGQPAGNGKEQFIVLTAMQRTVNLGLARIPGGETEGSGEGVTREGNRGGMNDRAHATCRAQAREVGGESVREIHCSGGQPADGEHPADGEARVGEGVAAGPMEASARKRGPAVAQKDFQTRLGATQPAGYKEGIAGMCTAARERAATRHLAEHSEGGGHALVAAEVATDQVHTIQARGAGHTLGELSEPAGRALFREGEGKKKIARSGSHRGKVAHRARQGLVTDHIRRVEPSEKMPAFDERIRAHDPVVRACGAQDGSIVSDAEGDAPNGPGADATRNDARKARDHRGFIPHHGPFPNVRGASRPDGDPQPAEAPRSRDAAGARTNGEEGYREGRRRFPPKISSEPTALAGGVLGVGDSIFLDFVISCSLHSTASRISSFGSGTFAVRGRRLRGQAAETPGWRLHRFQSPK